MVFPSLSNISAFSFDEIILLLLSKIIFVPVKIKPSEVTTFVSPDVIITFFSLL